ncbi:DNA-3-methyladenine glycosylase 1 [Leucoagaricus sp. SymC.cos]|nr:DNA-3-methyladenine glycosylase 1 [Leucoagaricus sp. SymC.cos]
MPTTRSSARLAANAAESNGPTSRNDETKPNMKKRAIEDTSSKSEGKKKARKAVNTTSAQQNPVPPTIQATTSSNREDIDAPVPAKLTFSLEEAKRHLIGVDHRFEDIFDKMVCKPYENLEQFHPFRALSSSILGQQISWLAARSIIHKFKRLYDPTLPEKPGEGSTDSFPTPAQVAATDLSVLKTAGLSTRKAEYIQDLAKRFADGRLSTQKILSANDEELAEMLIEVRGIGRVGEQLHAVNVAYPADCVDMFAIFSLRRPDILPVGDLGVQRGIARWALASHSPADRFSISPQKISQSSTSTTKKSEDKSRQTYQGDSDDDVEEGYLPVLGETNNRDNSGTSKSIQDLDVDMLGGLPPPFTPSISKTLQKPAGTEIRPLPKTLSIAELKARISGKKKIKGALLTPQEMEDLTEAWKPYRSIGGY